MSRSLISTLASRYGHRPTNEERRAFLRASLAAGMGMMLSGPALAMAAKPGAPRAGAKRVVVIGAGFAGLACAYELRSVGYDVSVVDARPKVGGRVLSFNAANGNEFVPGRNVEGGAELIGSNHPSWVAYADKFGLEWLDVTEDEGDAVMPVVIDGKALSFEEAGKLWEDLEPALNKMNELAADVPEDEPWKAAKAAEWDKSSTWAWIKSLELPPLVQRAVWINQTSDNGQDADKQSLLGQLASVKGGGLEKYWTDSEIYRCKGGNQQLAFKLAEGIGKDRITLELPATEITQKGGGLVVKCRDGRTIECDDVVLAAAPTTWQKIQMGGALPASLKPQMGLNTKHLSHTKGRFWQKSDPVRSQYALSDGLINQTWEGSDAQEGDGSACLTGFSGGPEVERALAMGREDREHAFATLLETFYPGYKENTVATRYMDWPKDPWVMASYSFPAPGQVTSIGPALQQAYMGGRLHLAGEHCCYKFVGYMEGALSSGISVAKRLARRDGLA